jgi:hypothetical protein
MSYLYSLPSSTLVGGELLKTISACAIDAVTAVAMQTIANRRSAFLGFVSGQRAAAGEMNAGGRSP